MVCRSAQMFPVAMVKVRPFSVTVLPGWITRRGCENSVLCHAGRFVRSAGRRTAPLTPA